MTKRRNTIKCPECGDRAEHEVRTDTVEYKGQKASVRVSGHWCDKCGEAVLEGEALEKRERAFLELRAKVEGVLSPHRVASIRERLKLSQRRAGELLGGSPRAFQKYESGSQQVSVPMTNLLRLLEKDPRRLGELARRAVGSGDLRRRRGRLLGQHHHPDRPVRLVHRGRRSVPRSAARAEPSGDRGEPPGLDRCLRCSAQCELFNRVLDELVKNHPNDLRVVYRPLAAIGVLDKSQISVQAALAAGDQSKFWEMRDLLHAQYNDWVNLPADQFETWVADQAASLGLDGARFKADLKSPETEARAKSMYDAAIQIGISGIPTIFINGSLQPRAALSYNGLDSTISLIALGARQFKSCPPFTIDPAKQYIATLHTEKGDIVIQLFPDKAPLAVNSFVFLARQGWFDGVTFHRVIPGFVAQTGDPTGTGRGGPGYFFKNEINADLKFDKPGVVGMANSGPDTNGSQFFITYAPTPNLDGSFTIFGQVLQGMDVLEQLTPREPQQSSDLPPGDRKSVV